MKRLAGHRILVTGAASGIGQATALRLLDEGAAVVAADVAADGLEKTRAQAQEAGGGERLTTLEMNIGDEPSVVVAKVESGLENFGYNAATGEYGDLVQIGVIDPTKVTRTALQNAASVAALILTTDATVAEVPKETKAATPAPAELDY